MDILDSIKNSIESNNNLDNMTKSKLFELIIIFHNKFPDIKLDKFNELSKTVKLGRIGKYEAIGTSFYDVKTNEMLISPNRVENIDYNLDNIFMRMVLSMITSTGEYYGFNSSPDLRVLNNAYEEILANYIVGSSEVSDQEEEMVITNILANIINKDKIFEAYFSNNGNILINELKKIGDDQDIIDLIKNLNHFSEAKQTGSIHNNEYASILSKENILVQKAEANKMINPDTLTDIYALYPNSNVGYNDSINHNGLEVPKNQLKDFMVKCGINIDNYQPTNISVMQK